MRTKRDNTFRIQDLILLFFAFLLARVGAIATKNHEQSCSDSGLSDSINAVRFGVADGQISYRMLATDEGPEQVADCMQLIRNTMPHTIHPKLLQHVIDSYPFSILLLNSQHQALTIPLANGQAETPMAKTVPASTPGKQASAVVINIDFIDTPAIAEIALRNELHSLGILAANYDKLTNPAKETLSQPKHVQRRVMPFLSQKGKISRKLYSQHNEALAAGFSRMRELQALHEKHGLSTLAQPTLFMPADLLKDFYRVIGTYTPMIRNLRLSEHQYQEISDTEPNENGRHLMHSTSSNTALYVTSIQESKPPTKQPYTARCSYAKGNEPADKAVALFKDFQNIKQDIDLIYAQAPKSSQATLQAELSSFVEQLSPELKQLIFPEWCGYFSSYTGTDRYCSLGTSKHQ